MQSKLHPNDPITVTVSPKTASVAVGGSKQLNVTVENAEDEAVTWSSSDNLIASVDNKGLVTVVAEVEGGTVDIIATSNEDPLISATCKITITAAK